MNNSESPKRGIAALKAYFKEDAIAGFSVSLIALPLCLGIAIASGVPPLAGLITAIVGGIFASRIAGSFVTISGPAAGLIVITLGAAEAMGGAGSANGFAGYPHALGAIVIGGVIMALFGVLKVGKVGDYFPSAAVHGMLAAIGIIIIIKQFFPAIGVKSPKGEILEVASEIPSYALQFNGYALGVSMVSLSILIMHPLIKVKWVKLIPAPMWVLVVTIPLAFILGHGNLAMVEMPHNLLGEGGFQFPSFVKIGESAFWIAVIGFALVSAIESLLSAKAVDSLDPYKRNSDLDKDLIAMGAGSSLAAAIGGLPMISEIVRSSANVNNGAKTQWSNFYHGLFLLIYLLIGVSVIEMIPISALAAMLVFTGFKLASPREFKHMYKVGLMELEIFIVTLIAVLATDLIIGIGIGILFKYILVLNKGAKMKELFVSNCEVQNIDNGQIIYLRGAQIFSNYLSLKKKIDMILEDFDSVVLDFSQVHYVDHTVMEHIESFGRMAELNGKSVRIENTGALNPVSKHPLAARDKTSKIDLSKYEVDKRSLELMSFAKSHSLRFTYHDYNLESWNFYGITVRKQLHSIEHIMSKEYNGVMLEFADLCVEEGAVITSVTEKISAVRIVGISGTPKFYMDHETVVDRFVDHALKEDINFEKHPKFSRDTLLVGVDSVAVGTFFSDKLISLFEEHKGYYLASNGENLLLRKDYRLLECAEVNGLFDVAKELVDVIQSQQ